MSNRRRVRTNRRADIRRAEAGARVGARLEGCICNPDIEWPKHPRHGVVNDVLVLHEEGCPLEDTGRGMPIAIYDPPKEHHA